MVAQKRSRCQLSNKFPKAFNSLSIRNSMPDSVSCRNIMFDDWTESSSHNVSIFDRIVEHRLRCATAWLNVRVAAVNIEESCISGVKSSPKIHESVEVNTSISVIFSSNETLSWYRCKMVADQLGIQVATLGIGKEDIAALEAELLTHRFPQERVDNFVLSPQ